MRRFCQEIVDLPTNTPISFDEIEVDGSELR